MKTADIEDEDGTDGVFQVGGDEASEAFLAGGVPELEAAGGAFVVHVFA